MGTIPTIIPIIQVTNCNNGYNTSNRSQISDKQCVATMNDTINNTRVL